MQTSRELAKIDDLSVADAISYEGDRLEIVKLEGFLMADDVLTMPDDDARKVIRGKLTILARSGSTSNETDEDLLVRETLFEWEDAATAVFLSDGDRRIPLAFDLAVLPTEEEAHADFSDRAIQQGDSARTSRPVAVEYGDWVFPLPQDTWGDVDSVFTDVERRVLPQGQSVVIVAGLDTSPQGNQLIDPLGDRLAVLIGTEDSIRTQGIRARIMFALLSIPTGFASVAIGRSANRLRQEFIERSNER